MPKGSTTILTQDPNAPPNSQKVPPNTSFTLTIPGTVIIHGPLSLPGQIFNLECGIIGAENDSKGNPASISVKGQHGAPPPEPAKPATNGTDGKQAFTGNEPSSFPGERGANGSASGSGTAGSSGGTISVVADSVAPGTNLRLNAEGGDGGQGQPGQAGGQGGQGGVCFVVFGPDAMSFNPELGPQPGMDYGKVIPPGPGGEGGTGGPGGSGGSGGTGGVINLTCPSDSTGSFRTSVKGGVGGDGGQGGDPGSGGAGGEGFPGSPALPQPVADGDTGRDGYRGKQGSRGTPGTDGELNINQQM